MYVIGTAGHVDHGKSTLVQALTGIDPDRLAEEKAREMTIDLGFAWLTLGGEEVGVVDVPGHRDFIENMLAGVGGIDLALFVVAADEGIMPQTREHLAILDLLQVKGGVVALTKADVILADGSGFGPEWLDLVSLEVAEALSDTVLAGAPIIPVSARAGHGLDRLKRSLWDQLQQTQPRADTGRPRLPIDRVFTLPGFGTVVTGTLIGGSLRVGDAIEVVPAGLKGRVRGLQTHKTKLEVARPGSRVAINISGIDKSELKRGDVLAAPGIVRGSRLIDVAYRHLSDATAPLKHNVEVKLFTGAAEVLARARVLGAPQIESGERGWLQLALAEPAAVARGDHFILRRPSPGQTIGGGEVVDPHPGRRYHRSRPGTIAYLETLAQGTPGERLAQVLARGEPVALFDLRRQSGLDDDSAAAALDELLGSGQAIVLNEHVLSTPGWQQALERLAAMLADYHRAYPLRRGMPREELRSRLKLSPAVFNPLLSRAAGEGLIVEAQCHLVATSRMQNQPVVGLSGHTIRFTPEQETAVNRLMGRFRDSGVNSPSVKESKAAVGDELYAALVEQGTLQPVNDDVVYLSADYERLVQRLMDDLQARGRLNAAQVRDLLATSRKYAIALLEHLDDRRLTRRVGDDRVLEKNP